MKVSREAYGAAVTRGLRGSITAAVELLTAEGVPAMDVGDSSGVTVELVVISAGTVVLFFEALVMQRHRPRRRPAL